MVYKSSNKSLRCNAIIELHDYLLVTCAAISQHLLLLRYKSLALVLWC